MSARTSKHDQPCCWTRNLLAHLRSPDGGRVSNCAVKSAYCPVTEVWRCGV